MSKSELGEVELSLSSPNSWIEIYGGIEVKSFLSVIDSISDWSGRIMCWVWVPVMLLITLEVIRRYVFGAPTVWNLEVVIYLSGAVYILGGAYALRHHRHVNIDVLYSRCSRRIRAILDMVTTPAWFLFVGVILWAGADRAWSAAMRGEGSGTVWDPPIYPILAMIPLGAFLLLLQGLAKFIRDFYVAIGKEGTI